MLEEVMYIPNLNRNIISLGKLEKKGYIFRGEEGVVKVLREVMKGARKNYLYALNIML